MSNPDPEFTFQGRQLATYRIHWDRNAAGEDVDSKDDVIAEDVHNEFFVDDAADKAVVVARVAAKAKATAIAREKTCVAKAAFAAKAASRPHIKNRFEQQRLLKKHQRKDRLVYTPRRCELEGCDKASKMSDSGSNRMMKCGRCSLVMYCSKEHQRLDWPRHKKECKKIKALGLWGCLFDPELELARFPIGSQVPGSGDPDEEPTASDCCGICGKSDGPLMRTECCGNWICDNEDEYVMFSYSRQQCARSHRRYTTCGSHYGNGHSGDWRTCKKCADDRHGEAKSWYSTNGYNFTPGLDSDYPKGQMVTEACGNCGGRIATGFEGHSFSTKDGKVVPTCCFKK